MRRIGFAVLLVLSLVCIFVIDADGDALTQDFPSVTLAAQPPSELGATDMSEVVRSPKRVRRFSLRRQLPTWTACPSASWWHRRFLADPD